jgi:hypothetical protein
MSTAGTKAWLVLCGWHCPSRDWADSWEISAGYQALTISSAALACPLLPPPQSGLLAGEQHPLAPSQFFFCDSLSIWGKGGSGSSWTPICSQVPQKHLWFRHTLPVVWVAIGASCPFHCSGQWFLTSTEPQPRHVMPASVPSCLHLNHWGLLGFEIISYTHART